MVLLSVLGKFVSYHIFLQYFYDKKRNCKRIALPDLFKAFSINEDFELLSGNIFENINS